MFKSRNEIDMCSGPIASKLILYVIPIIISGYLQLLFNAADMAIVGQFSANGERSLAAVGSTSSLINLIVNVFMGLSTGANALVGRRVGAGDKEGIKGAVHTSVFLSILSGFIVMIIGIVFSKALLVMMGSPADIIDLSALYLKIYFLGAPFLMFYNFGAAILRSVGDTRRPLFFLMISGVLNVVLNIVLVAVFNMDVAGVAIATVVSQIVSAVLVFITLCRNKGSVRLIPKEIKPSAEELKQILMIGIPAGVQSSMFSLANSVVQSSINYLGTATMAACSAAASIEGFVYLAMNSFYQATLSFVSQNFGRRDFKRIGQIMRWAFLFVIAAGLISGTIVMYFNEFLVGLYISNDAVNRAEIINLTWQRNVIVVWPYFLCGVMEVLVATLRAIGKSIVPMFSTIIGVCGGRMFWIFVVFRSIRDTDGIDAFGIHITPLQILMLAWPFAWILTSTAHSITLLLEFKKQKRKDLAIEKINVINAVKSEQ